MASKTVMAATVAVAALAGLMGAAQAGADTSNAYAFINTSPEFSYFAQACRAVGLDKDHWFTHPRWEATIFVPTNAAMQNYLNTRGMTLKQWLSGDKQVVLKTLLQHIVSTWYLARWNELYDGQKQASLLTLVNHRSRLTIKIDKSGTYVTSDKGKGKMREIIRIGLHERLTIVPITGVLVPDLARPAAPKPEYKTLWDVITQHPGLEDLNACAQKAATINPGLKADLMNPNKVFTLMAPNAEGIRWIILLLHRSAGSIMSDAKLCERMLKYHLIPGKAWTAKQIYDNPNVRFQTLLPGHTLDAQFYHEHTVIVADSDTPTTRNRGKFWNSYPRRLPSVMPGVPDGTWDLRAGNSIVHVMDSFLLAKK